MPHALASAIQPSRGNGESLPGVARNPSTRPVPQLLSESLPQTFPRVIMNPTVQGALTDELTFLSVFLPMVAVAAKEASSNRRAPVQGRKTGACQNLSAAEVLLGNLLQADGQDRTAFRRPEMAAGRGRHAATALGPCTCRFAGVDPNPSCA